MVGGWIGNKAFSLVHRKNLVYNTCWEDPRLDHEALQLTPDDNVLVITSAGCNALDYAIQSPSHVYAVDMNPLQNALLELKLACIRSLSFDDFFQIFGRGYHSEWRRIYQDAIRPQLSDRDRDVWDRRTGFFDGNGRRKSFYFRGTSGLFAWMINGYLNRPPGLREAVKEILQADSVERQQEIYDDRNVSALLWRKPIRWAMRRDTTLAMLGVPRSQRNQIDRCYPGGIGRFIQDRIEAVFREIPLKDNYFWRVYLTGEYTPECCPEYLKQDNFQKLKVGLVDRVTSHTDTVAGFLSKHQGRISKFVLLDHMDWLYDRHPDLLAAEWQSIINRATPRSKVLWRSAALEVNFVDSLKIQMGGKQASVGDLLHYDTKLASELHSRDRVNTYGSFYIANLVGTAA
ncbi:MAG: S-adenosylmethionine--diacylglycerol 3-amino-3-carboxypropyl transferase [Saprospirales bacterium TMED214]|jgi:S-adenosylmethionine-diacylglycerol 3-amino-3-carboxypropyl transferase|nr:MAG: S-adenosylmethionine--diacylglycerol 3-amino-3-carboxypropyl transferase [Saprospirales bacterium TMED214]